MADYKYHGIVGVSVPVYGRRAQTLVALFYQAGPGIEPSQYILATLDEIELSKENSDLFNRVFRNQSIPANALLNASADLVLGKIDIISGVIKDYEGFPLSHSPIVSSLDVQTRGVNRFDSLEKVVQRQKARAVPQTVAESNQEQNHEFKFSAAVIGDIVKDDKKHADLVAVFEAYDNETHTVIWQAALTQSQMLTMLPLILDAEKNGLVCEFSSNELMKAVKVVTERKKRIGVNNALFDALPHWPRPLSDDVQISLEPS